MPDSSNDQKKSDEYLVHVAAPLEDVLVSPTLANAFRIVHDSDNYLLYVFSVPLDLVDNSDSLRNFFQKDDAVALAQGAPYDIKLKPVAKLLIPPHSMDALLKILQDNRSKFLSRKEKDTV